MNKNEEKNISNYEIDSEFTCMKILKINKIKNSFYLYIFIIKY